MWLAAVLLCSGLACIGKGFKDVISILKLIYSIDCICMMFEGKNRELDFHFIGEEVCKQLSR